MLYDGSICRKPPAGEMPLPLHYFDTAALMAQLRREGYSLAEAARLTGTPIARAPDRLALSQLEEGLQRYLRQAGAPEEIARVLLKLPDPVSRRRLARRIVGEQLCIRDAALLVRSALRSCRRSEPPGRPQVIAAIRDVRLYRNAIRDIAEQMKTAGVRASFSERRAGGMQELTVAYPARRRRVERYQSMYT